MASSSSSSSGGGGPAAASAASWLRGRTVLVSATVLFALLLSSLALLWGGVAPALLPPAPQQPQQQQQGPMGMEGNAAAVAAAAAADADASRTRFLVGGGGHAGNRSVERVGASGSGSSDSAGAQAVAVERVVGQKSVSLRTPLAVREEELSGPVPGEQYVVRPPPLKEAYEKDEDMRWCVDKARQHKVKPFESWGSLPRSYFKQWQYRKCDVAVWIGQLLASGARLPDDREAKVEICRGMQQKHRVKGAHIQNLPPQDKAKWRVLHCTLMLAENEILQHPSVTCPEENMNEDLPLIAMLAGVTTRKMFNPSTDSMTLFKLLLPSFGRTLDCGFNYLVVIGYDIGDQYVDTERGHKDFQQWFYENLEQPLRKKNIRVRMKLMAINNTLKKPCPVFNEMARVAYREGAEYFFRVNDDNELKHRWPQRFVTALRSLPPPYGAVGPICKQGNSKILTHDFTHRTHMEIFDMNYYPPELLAWYMDDWISRVYGSKRTYMARDTEIVHHTGQHGMRYEVDTSLERLLDGLVQSGAKQIRKWMLEHKRSADELRVFDNDRRNGAPYQDAPR